MMNIFGPARAPEPESEETEPQPGPSWLGYSAEEESNSLTIDLGEDGERTASRAPSSISGAAPSLSARPSSPRSHEPHVDRSLQRVNSLTKVQASKSTNKIILDGHDNGYLAVVPPDLDRDLMKYAVPARDGIIGPRPIKASMLFEFDYRPKISSLLPHESHKEISARLNIAWKSISQDILRLYKDLAKKVEQRLRVTSVGVVYKRKGADRGRRNSREPPHNSGLRRCNCRPDCPKYKIIQGSDLEQKWLAKFRGIQENVAERETPMITGDGAAAQACPSNDASFASLNSQPTEIQTRSSLTEHPLQPFSHFNIQPLLHSRQDGPAVSEATPSNNAVSDEAVAQDITLTAANDAGIDIESEMAMNVTMPKTPGLVTDQSVYYSMTMDQNLGYQGFPPFVDPTNLQQLAQFGGSYIFPDGTIVNAQGEPIALTLPPSQFVPLSQQVSETPSSDAQEPATDQVVQLQESQLNRKRDENAFSGEVLDSVGTDDCDVGQQTLPELNLVTDGIVEKSYKADTDALEVNSAIQGNALYFDTALSEVILAETESFSTSREEFKAETPRNDKLDDLPEKGLDFVSDLPQVDVVVAEIVEAPTGEASANETVPLEEAAKPGEELEEGAEILVADESIRNEIKFRSSSPQINAEITEARKNELQNQELIEASVWDEGACFEEAEANVIENIQQDSLRSD